MTSVNEALLRLAALLALAPALLPATAVAARDARLSPATQKIRPDDPLPAETTIQIEAARNEWEAFQIVLRDDAGIAGIDVELSDLAGPDGALITADRARLYRQWFLDVVNASDGGVTYHERATGLYPDPLIPFSDPWSDPPAPLGAPFDLAAGETGAVFIDLHVPIDAVAGDYAGIATVTATDGWSVELAVNLTVWEFEIPLERTVATSFGFSAGLVRGYHGGPDAVPAADYDAIVARYYAALHEHRIDPTTIQAPLSFAFDVDDNLLPVDWSAYDAEMAPWLDGSRFSDGVGVTRFNPGYFRAGSSPWGMSEAGAAQAAAAFAEHLDAMGWWERAYFYATDEPYTQANPDLAYQRIADDIALLNQTSDLWQNKSLVTSPYDERLDGLVGIWCPVTAMYEDWFWLWDPKPGWDTYSERLALGEQLWFYVCNANTPPFAGYDIDSTIGHEPRIIKWGAWFERASGFLYWRVNYWTDDDPWHVLLNVAEFGEWGARNGDGLLLFPGDHDGTAAPNGSPPQIAIDGPIETYRLKQVRDGLEDWEMFRLASELGGEAFTREQVSRAYTRFGDFVVEACGHDGLYYCPDEQPWTLDDAVLRDARRQVAEKILFLSHPDRYPDPEAEPEPEPEPSPELPTDTPADGCDCQSTPAPGVWILGAWTLGVGARRRWRRRRRGGRDPTLPSLPFADRQGAD